jgi:hypothetical protein
VQIRWGNTFLEANGAGLTVARRGVENAANVVYRTEVVAAVEGWLTGTQAQLIAKCAALERGLAVPYQDLVLIANDGTIALRLANAGSMTGTRVLGGVDYPDSGRGSAEFVNRRLFRFAVSATYPLVAGPVLLDFLETVEDSGGGPVIDFQRPVNAAPIPVQIYPAVEFRATQQGFAVSRALTPNAYPVPPGPLWRGLLLQTPTFRKSGRRVSAQEWELRVEWAYQFGSATAFLGGLPPNVWR